MSWQGTSLPGGRTHALLAALVAAGGQVSEERLVDEVWGPDDVPANPAKALQVVVSRARSQTAPEVVTRTDHGYRLGLPPDSRRRAGAARRRGGRPRGRGPARPGAAPATSPDGRWPLPAPGQRGATGRSASSARPRAPAPRDRRRGARPGALRARRPRRGAAAARGRAGRRRRGHRSPRCCAPLAAVHGAPAALDRYERHRERARRPARRRPRARRCRPCTASCWPRTARCARGCGSSRRSLVGRDEDIRALRAAVRESRVDVDPRARRAGQDPAGAPARPRGGAAGRALRRAGRRRVARGRRRRGRLGPGGPRLGQRPAGAHRRAAQRRPRPHRAAARPGADPAHPRQLRARRRGGRRPGRLPRRLVPPAARGHHHPRAAGDRGRAGLRAGPARPRTPPPTCSASAPRRPAPAYPSTDEAVRRVVRRLDGLPLAIELAAAKVRAMSVEDIDRRLDDRFALLRGGDRSAPDRHQTLIAVIDWSWNLLTRGRAPGAAVALGLPRRLLAGRAGRRCSGATRSTLVQSLVDQSLLTVIDAGGTVRYRMLETVREFGRMQLVGAGEDDAARAAHLAWARALRARRRAPSSGRAGQVGRGPREWPSRRTTSPTPCARRSRCPTRRRRPSSPPRWPASGPSAARTPASSPIAARRRRRAGRLGARRRTRSTRP